MRRGVSILSRLNVLTRPCVLKTISWYPGTSVAVRSNYETSEEVWSAREYISTHLFDEQTSQVVTDEKQRCLS
jgi:hypothetical protein